MAPPRVLVVHHTVEGQTARIAGRIGELLRSEQLEVTEATVADDPDPAGYDLVVIGGSIHVGRHSPELVTYLTARAGALAAVPTALFQVSLTSVDDTPDSAAEAGGLVAALCEETGLDPDLVARFAGALAYTRYGWMKRRMMQQLMKRSGGETDTTRDHDYTDWSAVEGFAADLAAVARSLPEG